MKATRPIRPNLGVKMRYQRALIAMIREMAESVDALILAQRKAAPPVQAADETPAAEMEAALRKLVELWNQRFDTIAKKAAALFVLHQAKGVDASFRQALREAGWSIQFKLTPAMQDALDAMIAENVGLIRSIPAQYLQEIEGIVMRNYAAGRNLHQMALEIRARYPVAKRRAMLIARDQSNKCTSIVQRVRMKEIGITEAIWMHSHGGKVPRPTHVAMNGKRYKIGKGMWDSAEKKWIYPGELINCRCTSRAVLPWTPAEEPQYVGLKTA